MSTKFKKTPATTRLSEELMQKVSKAAEASRRPISNVIELCVERALPDFEREIEEFKQFQETRAKKTQKRTSLSK